MVMDVFWCRLCVSIICGRDSESILNGTLNAKLNRLYQCQSKIVFITILGHCFTTYPGSERSLTTYPGRGVV